jgi:hypothetical protein
MYVPADELRQALTSVNATLSLRCMDTGVVVALIAAFASLLAVLIKAIWDGLEKRRQQQLAERTELRRYRALLFGAADDLGNRIDNIRNKNFFYYLGKADRRDIALRSTLFRFGQYFTWTEIYREYLRLNPRKDTQEISNLLGRITATFSADSLNVKSSGPLLMLWREEQLAIADSMRQTGTMPGCIGFDTFMDDYDTRYSKWFKRFESDLESIFARSRLTDSERLARVQAILAQLIVKLDAEEALVQRDKDGEVTTPPWARRGRFPELQDGTD